MQTAVTTPGMRLCVSPEIITWLVAFSIIVHANMRRIIILLFSDNHIETTAINIIKTVKIAILTTKRCGGIIAAIHVDEDCRALQYGNPHHNSSKL